MGIFQDIPNDVLADEKRKIDADNWAAVQRRQLADEWAAEQRRLLGLTGVPTPMPSQTDVYTGLRQAQSAGIPVPGAATPEQPDAMSQAWQGFNERVVDPPRSALQYTLDVLSRPNYASAGVASEIVKPTTKPDAGILDRTGAVLEAGRKGIMGEQRKQYSDVLGETGMEPGRARDVLGFVGDVALDPTTYLTLGAGVGAKAGLKAGIPFTKAETTLLKGDPLKAIVNAASAVAERIPGGSTIKDIAGETFVSDYGLKKAGYGDFAEQMAETRRMPGIARQEATAMVRKHFNPLTEDQRTEFFRLADKNLEKTLGPGATSADIQDDAVRTVYEWYSGEYAPTIRQMRRDMGGTSFLDDYIRHVFPEKVKPKETAIGRPPTVRDPGSFKHRTGAAGFTEDPRIAIGFNHAEMVTRKATNDLVNTATSRYGQKLKPKQSVPEGYREYFPKGNLDFYRGEYDPASRLMKQVGQADKLIEPELSQVGMVIEMAEEYGVPVVSNPRLRSALGRFISKGMGRGPAKIELEQFTGRVAGHEFGHLYDWVLGGPSSEKIKAVLMRDWGAFGKPQKGGQFFRELFESPLAQNLPEKYGGKLYRATPHELFAEWFSTFVRNPEEARRQTPGFTSYFEGSILDSDNAGRIDSLRDFISEVESLPNPAQALRGLTGQSQYFEKALRALLPTKNWIGVRKGQRVALPEPIAQALETLTSPEKTIGILKLYDTVQNIWKASVTSYFPEFHARNMLGNFYNNWLAGIYDPRAYLQASKMQQATRTGDFSKLQTIGGVDPKTLYAEMQKSGVVNSGFYRGEILEELKSTGQDRSKIMQALSAGRTVGEALENNAKIAHVISQLDKGMALPDALRSAKKYLFDYTDLAPAEKALFRRVVPFYTWTRKNIPLQIESIIREPRKPLLVEKAREGLSQEENYRAEMELAPNYVAEQLNIVTGKDEQGNLHVLSGLGLPLEDLNRFFKITPGRTLDQLASMASPLLRIPVERLSNHSFFTGKPIDDDATNNYYKRANSVLNAVPGLRDWLEIKSRPYKDAKTGETRTAYTADPMKNYIFLSVMGRVATTAGKFSSEQRSIPGAIAEITLPGKDYIVDPSRSQVPFTEKMVASQDKKASELDKIAREFFAGKYSGAEAREVRSRALGEAGKEMSLLREQTAAKEAEYIPNIEAKEKLRQQMLPENEKLLAEYYDIQPKTTEPIGEFIKRLDEFKAKLTPEQQKAFDAAQEKQLAELEKRSPLAAKMERDYRQGIKEYRSYRELEELSGYSRNFLDMAAEFAQQKRDTARSVPGADSKKVEAVVARFNPDGALAYKAKQMFDKSAKGKKLKEIRQNYWASHSPLQRWFSDSILVEGE